MYTFYEIIFACLVVFGIGGGLLFWFKSRKNRQKTQEFLSQTESQAKELFEQAEAKLKDKLEGK